VSPEKGSGSIPGPPPLQLASRRSSLTPFSFSGPGKIESDPFSFF
jgi:hypothetical protein